MGRIEELRERAARLNEELETGAAMKRIIEANGGEIIKMNAQEQLYAQGVNALGVSISDYKPYKPLTISIKMEKGQPYDRVTLRDEGDFHRSFFVEAGGDSFRIDATDGKRNKLVKKYGANIFGLTPENLQRLIDEIVRPAILTLRNDLIYG